MNWEAIGAISDALGVVAILISLPYLAVQIRHSTREFTKGVVADQLAVFERNIDSGNRMRELLILHPDLLKLLSEGYVSFNALDESDKLRFGLLIRNIFSSMQGAYIRNLTLQHESTEVSGSVRLLDEILRHRGVREWLQTNRPDWRSEFSELVDLRLEAINQEK